MGTRIYNGMLPLMVDMVSATVSPEVGKAIAKFYCIILLL